MTPEDEKMLRALNIWKKKEITPYNIKYNLSLLIALFLYPLIDCLSTKIESYRIRLLTIKSKLRFHTFKEKK